MGNALTALALSITLEEFTHLKEEHDEDGFWELRLSTRKEPNAEGPDGGYRHEEVLVEGITVKHALDSFLQRVVSY